MNVIDRIHSNPFGPSHLTLLGAVVALGLSGACGPLPVETGEGGGSGGTATGGTGGTGGTAETQGLAYDHLKPNVMLLVDRSGSMAEPGSCGEATCPSRWEQLVALGPYLSEVSRNARLGMAMFPAAGVSGCNVDGAVAVPLSDDTGADEAILASWTSNYPGGQTPLSAALDEIGEVEALVDPNRDNVLVVLTDGRPNCACNQDADCETSAAVEAVERLIYRDVPLNVYFVGFGTSIDEVAADTLSAMAAVAADEHGQSNYYQVDTIEELIGLMYQVGQSLRSCAFDLDEWPEPSQLITWFDGEEIPACVGECTDGYTYDPTTGVVDLVGGWCDSLNDGNDHSVWFDTRD